jgi:hypothetical protein
MDGTGGGERVEEQQALEEWIERVGFALGTPMIRVEDSRGVQEVVCQPETASESAGADATGTGED